MAGFVQIAMDFGFPPAEGEVIEASLNNGTHESVDSTPKQDVSTVQEAARAILNVNRQRLMPPPADKILAHPYPEEEESRKSPEDSTAPEISIPENEPVKVIVETYTEEVEAVAEPERVGPPAESVGVAQNQNDQPAEPFEYASPSLPGTESNGEISEEEEDGLIEFELDYSVPEEAEVDFEKQIATVYFEKASPDEDAEGEEVIEIPIFNKPTTGADAHPVMIVRVKEKKEAGSTRTKTSPSKRGRKSVREMMADAEMVSVPEDEILFQKQYYPIGEVAAMFSVNTSLIRFWETEFDIIKPKKNKKGDRFFRPVDVKNLHLIYNLLRLKKFTIEGAKEYLKSNRKKAEKNFEVEQSLRRIKNFLLQLKAEL